VSLTATRGRPRGQASRRRRKRRLSAGVRRRIGQVLGALAWIIAVIVGLSVLAGLLSGGEWPWVVVTYLRWPQVVLIVLATVVLAILRWWRSAIASAAVAAALIASVVVPLTALRTIGAPSGETLRIAVFNTGAGPGDVAAVATAIRAAEPDVAVLLESEDIAADLDERLDDLSRLSTPVDGPETSAPIVLARRDWPVDIEPLGDARPATIVSVEIGGRPVDIVAAHPFPPISRSWARSHERSISLLLANVLPRPDPYVLACDCNTTPWTPSMRRLSNVGLRQPTVAATFGAPVIGMPLDHVLLSRDVGAVSRELGPFAGSDHRLIVTEIALQPAR
jgi:endonuclease/exonuclease/phosphatase (EEP) superfamily protein YafD